MHLLVQRNPHSKAVLQQFEVTVGDQELGPDQDRFANWKKIAVPQVSVHPDSECPAGQVPYLVFKTSLDPIEDLIVDVRLVLGSGRLMPCDKGYEKLSQDLRMNGSSTKKQEFLFFSVKRDR